MRKPIKPQRKHIQDIKPNRNFFLGKVGTLFKCNSIGIQATSGKIPNHLLKEKHTLNESVCFKITLSRFKTKINS